MLRVDTMFTLIGKTGFVYCVVQHSKWRMSIIFCLVALHIAPYGLVMPIFINVLVQYLTFLTVSKEIGSEQIPKSTIAALGKMPRSEGNHGQTAKHTFLTVVKQMHVVDSLRTVFP